MNKRSASPSTPLWASEASAKRRYRRGENVALAEAPQVERREAPHPYVTGVRAPSQGARRTLARFARVRIATHPAPPGAPFSLACKGEGKRGKGVPGARKSKSPGGGALSICCLSGESSESSSSGFSPLGFVADMPVGFVPPKSQHPLRRTSRTPG